MRTRVVLYFIALCLAIVACGGELPLVIKDELAKTSQTKPGAATIVFFTDFQCPFCRKTHAELAPLLEGENRARIRLVFRHVPLNRHPDARSAARAAVCVETLTPDLLIDYAHALFATQDLSEANCEALAIERGIDKTRYQECLSGARTAARIDQDGAMFDAARGTGVPLLYIGSIRLDGAQSRSSLEAAIDESLGKTASK
jgi:protein-disulfide isomerase